VLLKAGCEFLTYNGTGAIFGKDTLQVDVTYDGFNAFEYGEDALPESESFYLPTVERLNSSKGGDWY
jgi:hypothetical protein